MPKFWGIYVFFCLFSYFTVYGAALLFIPRLERRRRFAGRLAISAALSLCVGFFAAFVLMQALTLIALPFVYILLSACAAVILFLCVLFTLQFCFNDDLHNTLFTAVTSYAISNLGECVYGVVARLTYLEEVIGFRSVYCYLIRIAITWLIYALIYVFLIRKNDRHAQIGRNTPNIVISILILVAGLALNMTRSYYLIMYRDTINNIVPGLYLLCLVCTIIYNLAIVYTRLGYLRLNALSYDLETQKFIWKEKEKQLLMSKENADIISVKYHDLHHQIAAIRSMNAAVTEKTLSEVEEALNVYDAILHTGNDALDAVLTDKRLYCERLSIRLSCIADGKALGFMTSTDIITLFANILENSVEAVAKLDTYDRTISFVAKEKNGLFSICVENPYLGDLLFKDGLPVSTKGDLIFHGIGMRSVKTIIKKYNGVMNISADDNIFSIKILLPVPEAAEAAERK